MEWTNETNQQLALSRMLKTIFNVPATISADIAFVGSLTATVPIYPLTFREQVYRSWIVWGYNPHVIVIPCLALVGLAGAPLAYLRTDFISSHDAHQVAGTYVMVAYAYYRPEDAVFTATFSAWLSAYIAFTIWYVQQSSRLWACELISI